MATPPVGRGNSGTPIKTEPGVRRQGGGTGNSARLQFEDALDRLIQSAQQQPSETVGGQAQAGGNQPARRSTDEAGQPQGQQRPGQPGVSGSGHPEPMSSLTSGARVLGLQIVQHRQDGVVEAQTAEGQKYSHRDGQWVRHRYDWQLGRTDDVVWSQGAATLGLQDLQHRPDGVITANDTGGDQYSFRNGAWIRHSYNWQQGRSNEVAWSPVLGPEMLASAREGANALGLLDVEHRSDGVLTASGPRGGKYSFRNGNWISHRYDMRLGQIDEVAWTGPTNARPGDSA